MAILLWLIAAYMVGCLNGGYYAVKLKSGQDIRALGSGNAGATNAGRLMGKRGFLLVMFFDAVKMLAALKLAALLFPGNSLMPALTMPAVLLGRPVDTAMCVSLAAGMALILAVSLREDRTVRDAAKRAEKAPR